MLNRIIHFALTNRIAVLLVTGVLLLWGCQVLLQTDVDIFPDLNAPTVVVMTEAPGMAPEEVEKAVTFPVETALNGASGVRRVRSSSSTGFSVVWVEFDWDTDVFHARQIVNEKLGGLAEKMPTGVGIPVLGPQSSIMGEMMIIGITSRDSTTTMGQLRNIADRQLGPRLLALGGVAQISVIGGDVEEYQILLNPSLMSLRNVTLQEVDDALQFVTTNVSGGIIYSNGNEYLVKGQLSTSSVDDIARTVVKGGDDGVVTLADIATVRVGAKRPILGVASERTKPAVLITITKQPAASTIKLTKAVESCIAQVSSTLPSDVMISTDIFRQADFIDTSISNLQQSLFEGAIFVIIVLFFFLMNVRTTLISIIALPLSILMTVLILHFLGFTINTMSLGGIAIAIGSLVDDAIVDVENVYKRLRQNSELPPAERKNVAKVVYDASCEVRLPILNSSLIIVASFTPLFFLTGIEGRLLIPLGISFIVALLASTIVALTVTPVLCYYLLTTIKSAKLARTAPTARWLQTTYSRALEWALRHRSWVLGSTVALFIFALCLTFTFGRSFLPPFNEGSLTINVSTLPGISIEESNKIGTAAEDIIMSLPEFITVARKTGRAELDEHSLGVNVSEIEAPYRLIDRSKDEMLRDLRHRLAEIPGANIEIGQPISHRIDAMLSGSEAQIAVKVFGSDLNQLYNIGSQIKNIMSQIPGMVDVNIEQQIERPQIEIRPRKGMLARYGVTNAEFARLVQLISGIEVSQVYDSGMPYDVTLRVDDKLVDSPQTLADIAIDTPNGRIPLGNIADIISTTGPNTINRENVSRRIVVSANLDHGDLRGAVDQLQHEVREDITLPEGYSVTYGGQFESEEKASRTLLFTSLGAILLIFLLLYHEYHNIVDPTIILLNMPLAAIGGVILIALTTRQLNIPAIIGFISLIGIATRNGMLLISRYSTLKQQGLPLHQIISQGSVDRLNPIIMTALSSALALIPLALRADAPGNEIQAPLAIVILGGLLTSTFLNIFVVPIVYSITEKKNYRKDSQSSPEALDDNQHISPSIEL